MLPIRRNSPVIFRYRKTSRRVFKLACSTPVLTRRFIWLESVTPMFRTFPDISAEFSKVKKYWNKIISGPNFDIYNWKFSLKFFDFCIKLWPNFRSWSNFRFLTKFSIFDQISGFWPNFWFLTKFSIFDKIFDLLTKISIKTNIFRLYFDSISPISAHYLLCCYQMLRALFMFERRYSVWRRPNSNDDRR